MHPIKKALWKQLIDNYSSYLRYMVLRILLLFLSFCLAETLISQRHIHNVPEAMVSLQASKDGTLITISQSGKLYSYDGAEFTLLQSGINGAKAISKHNEGFVLTSKVGVWKWSKGKIEQQLMNEECYSYISIDGKEFVLTETGMHVFKEGRYQLINDWTTPISSSAQFYQLGEESYLSNDKTIYTYRSGEWKVLARDTSEINDITFFLDAPWVATDSGLRKVNEKSIMKVVIDGLDNSLKIDQLFVLGRFLYIQSEGELLKWNPSSVEAAWVDYKSSPSGVVEDYWGDIWFAEEDNIFQHKIGNANLSEPIISNITIGIDGILQSGQEIIVNEEGSDIRINYGAIHLRQPKDIKFQSLLSPLSTEYQSITTDRSIVYNDLPAGEYTYRLRSTVDGSQYAYSNPVTIRVNAKNEVSSLWWILGASCLFLLFLALFSNYRLQQYKEKSSLLTSKLRTANDLLKSQQKTMQLQMNPHFLFNALNSIQGLVSLNRNDEAKTYLRKFSRMMRSVLDFSTVDKIDLQQEIDYLNDYLNLEQMTRSNSFSFEINIEDSLLQDDIKLPPMILQPFIENAIIHGVSSIKNGIITIDIKDQETQLHCTILDNGIGRQAAAYKKKSTHKSVAVSLAQERLQKLSIPKKQDAIQYKDLPQGTQVDIHIPI